MTILLSRHSGLPESGDGASDIVRLAKSELDHRSSLALLAAGLAATLLLFLLLPLMQVASAPKPPTIPIFEQYARPVPPEWVPPPIPEQKQPDPVEKPKLDPKLIRPPIAMIPVTLNPTGPLVYVPESVGLRPDVVEDIFDAARLQRAPVPAHVVEPVYPRDKLRDGIAGIVVLEFIVTPQGTVRDVKVISSTHRDFEQPAAVALAKWRFEPGMKDNTVVFTRMRLPIQFKPPR